jgi:glutathionylspermidine synthase
MLLRGCKWDAQIGDTPILPPFALILPQHEWQHLAQLAQNLAHETLAAEQEILRRPELWPRLAIPRPLQKLLRDCPADCLTPSPLRVMRFDFHPTPEGWRISEVNADVPGGYSESSLLPTLMAEALDADLHPAGNPVNHWCSAMRNAAGDGPVGLLCAPGYMEDRQILCFLGRCLAAHGLSSTHLHLPQLPFHDRQFCDSTGRPFRAILRFYQAEWLAQLPRRLPWRELFAGSVTPVVNAAAAIFTESKAFPLVWNDLGTFLPTWRSLLPITRAPDEVPWQRDTWLLKEAFSNNGDSVLIPGITDTRIFRRIHRELRWLSAARRRWVAQQRFSITPVETALGPMYPCLGIYVINGNAAGIYARISHSPIIDYTARDVALLIDGSKP